MSGKIIFDYFKSQESEMLSFYRIPKLLFTNDYFADLDVSAKVLYGLMLERMSLSLKNSWFDSENRAYIYFSQQDAMELLNCKVNKVISLFKELDKFGLIERKKQGQGKPDVIYLKNFVQKPDEKKEVQNLEKPKSESKEESSELGKTKFKTLEKPSSGTLQNQVQDLCKTNPNYTNINYTKGDSITNHISSKKTDLNDKYNAYAKLVRENLALDEMLERYPQDRDIIEGIYDLILETIIGNRETVWIAQSEYPLELVKSKFLKLDSEHLEYVLGCLKDNTTKVRNIKKYMLSMLFNAPSTIGGYYQAEVNYGYANRTG